MVDSWTPITTKQFLFLIANQKVRMDKPMLIYIDGEYSQVAAEMLFATTDFNFGRLIISLDGESGIPHYLPVVPLARQKRNE